MSRWAERELSGWGRVHKARCLAARPERQAELAATLASEGTLLAFGAGRSYGDVALKVFDLPAHPGLVGLGASRGGPVQSSLGERRSHLLSVGEPVGGNLGQ